MDLNEALKICVKNISAPDDPVYHYTKPDILPEIIKCRYLILNPHHYLNKKNINNDELRAAVEIIKSMLQKFHLCYLIPKFDDYIQKRVTFYTVSFSQEEKCEWVLEKYGSTYIEFNPEFLRRFSNSHDTLFGSVEYSLKRQRQILSGMFDAYQEYKETSLEPEVDLFTWLNVIIPLFKDEKHSWDNECRIVGAEIWDSGKRITPECPKELKFADKDIKIHA